MQRDKLSKLPLFPFLAGGLLLSLAAGSAWADPPSETGATQNRSPASNIEGWNEDEREDDLKDNWTWFGMGYESRISSNSNAVAAGRSAAGTGGAGAAGVGAGSAAAVMNQRGPGRR